MNKIWKNPNVRIAAFVVGIFLVLLVGSIVAILYANGVQPAAEGGFTSTGTLRVNSDPSDVTVLLDQEPVQLDNQQVTGLTPGNYILVVNAEGYSSWTREVEIKAGLVTDVNPKLFPEQLNLTQLTASNIEYVQFSPDGRYVFYLISSDAQGDNIGIWAQRISQASPLDLFNAERIKITNLVGPLAKLRSHNSNQNDDSEAANNFESNDLINILVSSDGSRIILTISNENYLLNTNGYNEPSNANQIEQILPFEFDELKFLGNNLLVRSGDSLIEYNPDTKIQNLVHAQLGGLEYGVSRNRVYFTRNTESEAASENDSGETEQNLDSPTLYVYENGRVSQVSLQNLELPFGSQVTQAAANNDQRLLLNDANSSYYLLDIETSFLTKITEQASEIELSRNGETVIFAQSDSNDALKHMIFSLELKAATTQFNTKIYELGIPQSQIRSVSFATQPTNLLVETISGDVLITDNQGRNSIELLSTTSSKKVNGFYQTNSDNSSFLALITDSSQAVATNNLYQIDLRL